MPSRSATSTATLVRRLLGSWRSSLRLRRYVHDLLAELERELPDHARVVLLRFFAGLTVEETADALSTSVSSVERLWRFGRAWLRSRMG